jgi:hypothetical protein
MGENSPDLVTVASLNSSGGMPAVVIVSRNDSFFLEKECFFHGASVGVASAGKYHS